MFDIHQRLYDEDGERNEDAFEDYSEDLMDLFADSPEGEAIADEYGDVGWAHSFLYYAFAYLATTPPKMSCRDVRDVLFRLFPRKVSTTPDAAGEIIAELRAFWTFLQREYGLTNAAEILEEFDERAERRLRRELDNPRNFGMAKSVFMMGQQAGFDMTTEEGLEEFKQAFNAKLEQKLLDHSSDQSMVLEPPFVPYVPDPAPPKPKLFAVRLSVDERKEREKIRRAKLGKSKRRR